MRRKCCDPRLKSSGELRAFAFNGKELSCHPKTAFYNWLYINALLENEELAVQLLEFDAFTDIEFNPNKSLSCQAEAAATFVSLSREGLLDNCRRFSDFTKILSK